MAKLVIIEDDVILAKMVQDFLLHESHLVQAFHHGVSGEQFILAHKPDLIILDWDLPGKSGIEVLKSYRQNGGMCPVLMLTGHGDVDDKEIGFDSGADDYLTKPFNLKELGARVRGLLRRAQATVGNVVNVGDIVVDLDTNKVLKSGRAVTLMPREFQLLNYLVKNRNESVDPTHLLTSVWNTDSEVTMESMITVVRRLTKKLDPDGSILRLSHIINSSEFAASAANTLGTGAGGSNSLTGEGYDGAEERGDPMIGRLLDNKYEVVKVIGGGASGQVYKARHKLINSVVAIKVLAPQLCTQPELVKRFQREARAAGLLSHKNILLVHDFGVTEEAQPYMVMEYLNGFSLAELIKQNGKLAVADTLEIVSQICSGIAKAHERGLIHRDLKPGNIMLVAQDDSTFTVKIVDFGLAKSTVAEENAPALTQTGALIGTPSYMSPEQCRSEPTDQRCDLYAIGCMLYEMLTGEVPFVSFNIIDVFVKHAQEPPPPLSIADTEWQVVTELQYIVHRCLEKSREKRYQSADELLDDIAKLSRTANIATTGAAQSGNFL